MVMVNLPTAGVDYHVPFGGRKGSSYGPREQGRYAVEFFTAVKTATRRRRSLAGRSRIIRVPQPLPPVERKHRADSRAAQFAEVLVAAPVGRIDHAAAGALEQALAPLLAQAEQRARRA